MSENFASKLYRDLLNLSQISKNFHIRQFRLQNWKLCTATFVT